MSKAVENLMEAQKVALQIRPKIGGFPYMAEVLRGAGVTRNTWFLPACQSVYLTEYGAVVHQGTPLVTGALEVPVFDREAVVRALRTDQNGQSTFPEFLHAAWKAGVVSYEVDFDKRQVKYLGANGDSYVEDYPAVKIEAQK